MNDVLSRLGIVVIAVIAYLTGVIPADANFSEVSLTAIQWLGLLGIITTAYLSPSKVRASVNAIKGG